METIGVDLGQNFSNFFSATFLKPDWLTVHMDTGHKPRHRDCAYAAYLKPTILKSV